MNQIADCSLYLFHFLPLPTSTLKEICSVICRGLAGVIKITVISVISFDCACRIFPIVNQQLEPRQMDYYSEPTVKTCPLRCECVAKDQLSFARSGRMWSKKCASAKTWWSKHEPKAFFYCADDVSITKHIIRQNRPSIYAFIHPNCPFGVIFLSRLSKPPILLVSCWAYHPAGRLYRSYTTGALLVQAVHTFTANPSALEVSRVG